MAYQALYRKYRPTTFSDVVGQEHITETLKNELSSGKIVHAYLFTGTRGTGKTSCAKILAKAVNCLSPENGDPCLKCESCLSVASGENTDIVEIDAASNNSVDSIRDLRDRVAFAPSFSKYRVYIIDEVHMLTISAFNALLKTLEEPPEHVIFILATTEVHKLPATILSRCQRFDFKRIDPEKIAGRIKFVAEKEGLTVTDGASALIAAASDGGMRDALSILDLCASADKNIDEETVESVCGMAGGDYLNELTECIKRHDAETALKLIDKLYGGSVDMQRLLGELTSHYRDLMIIKAVRSDDKPIVCSAAKLKALKKLAEDYDLKDIMRVISVLQSAAANMQSGNRRCEMELTLLKLCIPELSGDIASLERRVSALEYGRPSVSAVRQTPDIKETEKEPAVTQTETESGEEEIPLPEPPDAEPNEKPVTQSGTVPVPDTDWSEIMRILKTSCPLIHGVLNASRAYIRGSYLLIDAPNSQFRSLINSNNGYYKDSIRKAAHTVLGVTYKLGPYTKTEAKESDPLAALADKLKNFEIN